MTPPSCRMALITAFVIGTLPLCGAVKIHLANGIPAVDGVYVNGYGPYRFLIDTGANINLIEPSLANKVGMRAAMPTVLSSAAGEVPTSESNDNEVALDGVACKRQKFLLVDLKVIHAHDPEIRGVLGQWFLSEFDYALDIRGRSLVFGKAQPGGFRVPFKVLNGRIILTTNLGDLVLDSAAGQMILFGVQGETSGLLRTLTGSKTVGLVSRDLIIGGQNVWHGEAVTMLANSEPAVDGLLPLTVFRKIYICNTDRYLVYE